MAKKTEHIDTTEIFQNLRVQLTDEELIESSKKLTDAMEKIDEVVSQKKEAVAHYKTLEEAAAGEAAKYRNEIRSGYVYRDIRCDEIKNWDKKTVTIIRLDTGEIVNSREMMPDEMQRDITGVAGSMPV